MFFFSTPPGAEPSIEHIYVDRGDPSDYDVIKTGFTIDADWHSLDLSAIVPAGTVLIHCRLRLYAGTEYYCMKWRKNGNSQLGNAFIAYTHTSGGDWDYDFWLACDENRCVEYLLQDVVWTNIDFVVRGWIVPGA